MNENIEPPIGSFIKKSQHLLRQPVFWSIQLQNVVALLSWFAGIRLFVYLLQFLLFNIYLGDIDITVFRVALSFGETGFIITLAGYWLYYAWCVIFQKGDIWRFFRSLMSLFWIYTFIIVKHVMQFSTYERIHTTADIPVSLVYSSIFCISMIGLGYLNKLLFWKNIQRSIGLSGLWEKDLSEIQKDRVFGKSKWKNWLFVDSLTDKFVDTTDNRSIQLVSRTVSLHVRYSWLASQFRHDYH